MQENICIQTGVSSIDSSQESIALMFDQVLRQANALQQAGRPQDAERLYRAILHAQPNNPSASHKLAELLELAQTSSANLLSLKTTLEANPNQVHCWLNYIDALIHTGHPEAARDVLQTARERGIWGETGEALALKLQTPIVSPPPHEIDAVMALHATGRYTELLAATQSMTQNFPLFGFAWRALGTVLKLLGRCDEALAPIQIAITLAPDDACAYNNLAIIFQDLHRLPEAEASYLRALQIDPNNPITHNNLGNLLRDVRQLDRALLSCRRALEINPDFAEAHINLGNVLLGLRYFDEAITSYGRALEIKPDCAEAHNNLGNALQGLGQFESAADSYRRALNLKADYVEAHNNLGNALQSLGLLEEAVASYHQALALKPDYTLAYNNLGNALQCIGRLEDAVAIHRQALEIQPELVEVRFNLALAAKIKPGDENMAALIAYETSLRNGTAPRLEVEHEVPLHFALGKCYDDVGYHDKAFLHFLEGCRLKRGTFDYDSAQTTQHIAAIRRNFDIASLPRLRGAGDPSRLPIFVLGMPRSGTTLIAQIISSHPEVSSAGELPDLMAIAQRPYAGANMLESLGLFDQTQLAARGKEYVQGIQSRAPGMRRIIDKMPQNFLAVGLIHLMLPNAKIIHVERNPVDTCLSCFTQLFTMGQEHTYDLAELGRYYVEYFRLMQYWRETLPVGTFVDVQYEDVVTDQEAQSRRILQYCGLEWHDACREPHKNRRPVLTASRVQVRQPVYQSSVQRWRKYERHLGPLLETLGDLVQHTTEC